MKLSDELAINADKEWLRIREGVFLKAQKAKKEIDDTIKLLRSIKKKLAVISATNEIRPEDLMLSSGRSLREIFPVLADNQAEIRSAALSVRTTNALVFHAGCRTFADLGIRTIHELGLGRKSQNELFYFLENLK